MKKTTKRIAALACVLLYLAVGVFPGPPQQKAQAKKKDERVRQRLIRKDLLEREAEPLKPPLRNIVAPQRPGAGQNRPGAQGPGIQDDNSGEQAAEQGEEAEETQSVVYDLRYIGYVRSTERTVAVVVFEGETLAVKPGDLISSGVTILKITPEEIVFQGTDAVSRTVSLEGEDR
jgi:hypothetical protein